MSIFHEKHMCSDSQLPGDLRVACRASQRVSPQTYNALDYKFPAPFTPLAVS